MKQADVGPTAIKAATASREQNRSVRDVSAEFGVSRDVITAARLVLEHGSASDLTDVMSGKVGISTVAERIREKLPSEARAAIKKRAGGVTDSYRHELQTEAAIWANFGPMLRNLSTLPKPQDMIAMIKRNQMREQTVNQHIDSLSTWMTEFINEWYRLKAEKPKGNSANAREGN